MTNKTNFLGEEIKLNPKFPGLRNRMCPGLLGTQSRGIHGTQEGTFYNRIKYISQ